MPFTEDLGPLADRSLLEAFDMTEVDSFYQFLKGRNIIGGFFSAGDAERIADRHLYECLAYVCRIMSRPGVSRETKILDAGSGPGLPGYLFTCLKDPPYVTLLDSSRRRLSFVEEYHRGRSMPGEDGAHSPERIQLLKGHLRFQYARAEESRGDYDIITARALIPFPFNAVLLRHLVKGQIMLAVGPSPVNDEAEKVLQRYGLIVEESCRMTELDFLGERNLLILRKKNRTVALPPVLWKTIKGEMDQWRKS
jgi:16S rRNA (guanine527-N7)-methyltransferase